MLAAAPPPRPWATPTPRRTGSWMMTNGGAIGASAPGETPRRPPQLAVPVAFCRLRPTRARRLEPVLHRPARRRRWHRLRRWGRWSHLSHWRRSLGAGRYPAVRVRSSAAGRLPPVHWRHGAGCALPVRRNKCGSSAPHADSSSQPRCGPPRMRHPAQVPDISRKPGKRCREYERLARCCRTYADDFHLDARHYGRAHVSSFALVSSFLTHRSWFLPPVARLA